MKVQQFLAHHGITETPSVRRTPKPTTSSASFACTPPITRRGTRSMETPRARRPRSSSAKRGAARRRCGCRWSTNCPLQPGPSRPARASSSNTMISIRFSTRSATGCTAASGGPTACSAQWRLWDHIDAILSLGVTRLVRAHRRPRQGGDRRSRISPASIRGPDRNAGLSTGSRGTRSGTCCCWPPFTNTATTAAARPLERAAAGFAVFDVAGQVGRALGDRRHGRHDRSAHPVCRVGSSSIRQWWVAAIIVAGWLPWLFWQARLLWTAWRTSREIRVFDHLTNTFRSILSQFERQRTPRPARSR